MHRTLARAYAPNSEIQPYRFLWRLEPSHTFSPSAVLLVQSDQRADWSVLDALPGYALEIFGNKLVSLEKLIQEGCRCRFRLLANPTVTRDGKRHGLVKEEEQRAWLERQGKKGGFELLGCVRGGSARIQTRQSGSGRRITLQTALFDGALEITDAELLRSVVCKGLGHGKALGLGLLSLARMT
jgi:CRISPR system Cascade subunit CasE